MPFVHGVLRRSAFSATLRLQQWYLAPMTCQDSQSLTAFRSLASRGNRFHFTPATRSFYVPSAVFASSRDNVSERSYSTKFARATVAAPYVSRQDLEKLKITIDQCITLNKLGRRYMIDELRRAHLRQYNDDAEAMLCLGEAYSVLGQAEDAIRCFKRSVELEPNDDWRQYFLLGRCQHGADAVVSMEHAKLLLLRDYPVDVTRPPVSYDVQSFLQVVKSLHEHRPVYDSLPESLPTDSRVPKFVSNEKLRDVHLYILENLCVEEMWCTPISLLKFQKIVDDVLTNFRSSWDVHQTIASCYMRIGDRIRAADYLENSMKLWVPMYEAVRDLADARLPADREQEWCGGKALPDRYMTVAAACKTIPHTRFRLATAKLLDELGYADAAEEVARNIVDVDLVKEYSVVSFLEELYERLGKKDDQKLMLEFVLEAGIDELVFKKKIDPIVSRHMRKPRVREEIVNKYVKLGGLEEELRRRAQEGLIRNYDRKVAEGFVDPDDEDFLDDDDAQKTESSFYC